MFGRGRKPQLSIVIVCYDMPRQIANALYSLSPAYQQGIHIDEYEIILVENISSRIFGKDAARQCGQNIRYFQHRESQATPVNAINKGLAKARADNIAVMIDGARLLTPGIVAQTLQAFRISPSAIVCTPGYHLGSTVQQESSLAGYDESYEQRLLESIDWQDNGYQLFTIACLSQSCVNGVFAPLPESNWLAMSRQSFTRIGGFHTGFNTHGGGYANHDALYQACELPGSLPVVLAGEGCFHQFHGGATTDGTGKDMAKIQRELQLQYRQIRHRNFSSPTIQPVILGRMPYPALPVLIASAERAAA